MRDKHIVITRPQKQAEKLASLIRQHGGIPLFLPMIKVVPIAPNPAFKSLLPRLLSFDRIIFTSKNGVHYFFEFLSQHEIPLTSLTRLKFAVVGTSTSKSLKNKGFSPDWIPSKFSGERLANELPLQKGERILIPRAAQGVPILPQILEKRGALVTDLPIYDTVEETHSCLDFGSVMGNDSTVVAFTSPSAVFSFKKHLEKCGHIPIKSYYAAIGPTTGKALSDCDLSIDILPEKYTLEAMIIGIKHLLEKEAL